MHNTNEHGLRGKVIIVTGVNNPKGIGAAASLAFAAEGAKVVMVYKRLDFPYDEKNSGVNGHDGYCKALAGGCGEVASQIKNITSDFLIIEGDIADDTFVSSVYDRAEARFGKVNILINNAAVFSENDTVFTISKADIDDIYDSNIKGTLLMIREFVKRFASSCGRVINLSTDSAQAFAGQIAYGSSKAAVEALTRAIAIETGPLGITVNAVAPGPTQTGWIDEELEKAVLPQIPLGRLGSPQDIVNAILFLASDKAEWITGQVIKVSGGHAL